MRLRTAIGNGEAQTIRSMIVDSNIDINADISLVSNVVLQGYLRAH